MFLYSEFEFSNNPHLQKKVLKLPDIIIIIIIIMHSEGLGMVPVP
jgi:hypothetical protein